MSVACLPMYDIPEVRGALDVFWSGLASHLRHEGLDNTPERLTHDRPVTALFNDPDLRFGQCCGSDLVGRHAASLQLVATPHYDVPGCAGAEYVSFVVVREDNQAAGLALPPGDGRRPRFGASTGRLFRNRMAPGSAGGGPAFPRGRAMRLPPGRPAAPAASRFRRHRRRLPLLPQYRSRRASPPGPAPESPADIRGRQAAIPCLL